MDPEVLEKFNVEDITEKTIGEDFQRNQKIHQCYLIRNKVKVKIDPKRRERRVRR